MFDKILKHPAGMAAQRLAQRLAKAADNAAMQSVRNRERDAEVAARRGKATLQAPAHDAMVRGTHQQVVAAATAPTRGSVKTAAAHVQAALKGPSPGLQLRSVRVAPPEAGNGPRQQGYAWVPPKARK